MYFTKIYSFLDYCTENTPSWAFFYSNILNSPMIVNMENSREFCYCYSEKDNFIDPSIQSFAAMRMRCSREKRKTIFSLTHTTF